MKKKKRKKAKSQESGIQPRQSLIGV